MDCSLPGSSVHGILQKRMLGSHSLFQGIFPTHMIFLNHVSGIAGRFFTTEPLGESHIPYMWNLKINKTKELTKQKQTHRLRKSESRSVVSNSVWPQGLEPTRLLHGILQARIPEWVAIFSSRGSSRPRDRTYLSHVFLHWQADSLPLSHWGPNLISELFFSKTKDIIYYKSVF